MKAYDIIKRPIITEKSVKGIMEEKFYTFEVYPSATRTNVKWAIEHLFADSEAKVSKVNIINVKPKKKRMGRYEGYKSGYKKAIVYLESGNIPIYGSEEESQASKDSNNSVGSKISSMVADSILDDKDEKK
ncbi:MAG: 50S ribosomal protein L23 [Mycoplasmataceae bacterium]|nr:50S ribosomal protein L23 [Mycoplasmataceae bacterium]